jgi:hypothetical protein
MIRNKTDTIVIKTRMSSAFRLFLIIVPLVLFFGGVGAAYFYGHWQSSAKLERMQKSLAELNGRHQLLNERYVEVQDSLVQLKRQLYIDDSAYTQLRSDLEQSNNQLAELRSELKFYRSIISPQEGQQGVRVQEIVIIPTVQPRTFAYKLVLIQTLQQGKELSGTVKFTIKGESDGEPRTINHPGDGQEELQVNFKYFQSLTGTLELPDTFIPLEVRVDLAGKKKKSLIKEKWYPWLQISALASSAG